MKSELENKIKNLLFTHNKKEEVISLNSQL